jgi:hypothetical protein
VHFRVGCWYEPDWSWVGSRSSTAQSPSDARLEAVRRLVRGLIQEFGAGAVIEAQLAGPAARSEEPETTPSEQRVRLVSARRDDGRYTIERVRKCGGPDEVAVDRILAMRMVQAPGPDDDATGSREPRRPGPLADGGAVALEPE